jgi:CRP-like cAMP-binding protein
MTSPQGAMAIAKALSSPARTDRGRLWAPVLKDMPLFADVPTRHLRKIAALTKEVRFSSGAPIVRFGEPGDAFFVILEGNASVVRPGGLPSIGIGPGDYFGEMALIDSAARSATVVAKSEVLCLRLATSPFMKMLRAEPEIAVVLLKQLAGRIRELQARSQLSS